MLSKQLMPVKLFEEKRGRQAVVVLYGVLLLGIIVIAGFSGGSAFGVIVKAAIRDIPWFDKLGHFVLFGALAFLVHWCLLHRKFSRGRWWVITLSVSTTVAAEECSQIWIVSRNFDLADLSADLVGILVFSIFAYFQMQRKIET